MAVFHGKQGRITFAATATSNVLNWSIDASADIVECSAMSAVAAAAGTHWKDYVAGYLDWTATVEAEVEDTGLDPDLDVDFLDDDGVAIVVYAGIQAQGVRKYSGTGIITGIAPALDKDGVATVTYTIQGNGTLTEAASDYVPA